MISSINSGESKSLPASASPRAYQALQINQERFDLNFKSKDGDTLTLNYRRIEATAYGRSPFAGAHVNVLSPEEGAKLREQLKAEMFSYKEALVKSLVEQSGGEYRPLEATGDTEENDEVAALEAAMPDYWSAENTSQRIVDFATSFLSAFEGDDKSEFFNTIRDAIKEGFKQAKELLGELPGAVGGLVNKTYKLTMDKLDSFEQQYNAQNGAPSEVQETA